MPTTRTHVRRGWALLPALLAACAAGCGGTPFPSSAAGAKTNPPAVATRRRANVTPGATGAPAPVVPLAPTTTIPLRTPPTPAPTTPPAASAEASLLALVPPVGVLGTGWADDGDPGTSLDLTNPPPQCTAFMPAFDGGTATVLHEFTYLQTPDGQFERGHMNLAAVRAASAPVVSSELAAVAQPAFAACAEASGIRRFTESEDGTFETVRAQRVYLAVGGPNVIWRVGIDSHTPSGVAQTMQMDVAYIGRRDALVKIRIATCGCDPTVTVGELLPGELHVLQAIALQLARA